MWKKQNHKMKQNFYQNYLILKNFSKIIRKKITKKQRRVDSEWSRKEIKKQLHQQLKTILRINIIQTVSDLYNENYKALVKKTETRNHKQMGRYSTVLRESIVKMPVLSKTVQLSCDIFIKISAAFFTQNSFKYFLKFILRQNRCGTKES